MLGTGLHAKTGNRISEKQDKLHLFACMHVLGNGGFDGP